MKERGVDVVQKAGWVANPNLTVTEVRTVMGSLGLTGDKSIRPIGHLSGGEKARVALACFSLVPHNMLLLDEPSNHLDVETIESLTIALRAFKGAVVVVSHDRKFCEALSPTHVMTVEAGKVRVAPRHAPWDEPEEGVS
jgi:ATP-binding cassette subfamily F protein 3